jgi:hypothetical protein
MSNKDVMLTNIDDKLKGLPLSFDDIAPSNLSSSLDDSMREIGIADVSMISDPKVELYVELRAVWWFLFRVRNSSSVFFKYSTGENGQSVDKSEVAKTLGKIMSDIDIQFKLWFSDYTKSSSNATKLWNMTRRASSTLTITEES